MLVHQPTVKIQQCVVCEVLTHTHACHTHTHTHTHTLHTYTYIYAHIPLIVWLSNNITGFAEFHHPGEVFSTAGAVVLPPRPHYHVHLHLLLLGPHTYPHHTLTVVWEMGWTEGELGGREMFTSLECWVSILLHLV